MSLLNLYCFYVACGSSTAAAGGAAARPNHSRAGCTHAMQVHKMNKINKSNK
jgi:hypothetical protein